MSLIISKEEARDQSSSSSSSDEELQVRGRFTVATNPHGRFLVDASQVSSVATAHMTANAPDQAIAPGAVLVPAAERVRGEKGGRLCGLAKLFLSEGDFSTHISRDIPIEKDDAPDTDNQSKINKELEEIKWWFSLGSGQPVRVTFNGFIEVGGEKYLIHDQEDVKRLLNKQGLPDSDAEAIEVQQKVLGSIRKIQALAKPFVGKRIDSVFIQDYLGTRQQPLFPHLNKKVQNRLKSSLGSERRLGEIGINSSVQTAGENDLRNAKGLKQGLKEQISLRKTELSQLRTDADPNDEEEIERLEEEIAKLREVKARVEVANEAIVHFILLELNKTVGSKTGKEILANGTKEEVRNFATQVAKDYNQMVWEKKEKKTDGQEVAALLFHIAGYSSAEIVEETRGRYGIPKGEIAMIQAAIEGSVSFVEGLLTPPASSNDSLIIEYDTDSDEGIGLSNQDFSDLGWSSSSDSD